jgi:hypothetical protein
MARVLLLQWRISVTGVVLQTVRIVAIVVARAAIGIAGMIDIIRIVRLVGIVGPVHGKCEARIFIKQKLRISSPRNIMTATEFCEKVQQHIDQNICVAALPG